MPVRQPYSACYWNVKYVQIEHRANTPLGLPLRLPRRAQSAIDWYSYTLQFCHRRKLLTGTLGNFALLPLRTRTRGPAIQLPALPADVTELTIDASHESYDPLDEILALFRANTFFRNFEIKGPADRVLIYGILFVSEVLGKIKPGVGRRDAEKVCCRQVG
jgi:hypothetical protein